MRIGIANPVTRHPAVLAMEAATLAEIAGPERLALGVGAAVWTMRALGYEPAGWQPYTNVVETVRALRQWLAGEALGFPPATFAADPSNRLDFIPVGPIRIDVGAVNARMMQAAGEVADGVQLGALVSPGYVRWSRERLAEGSVSREPLGERAPRVFERAVQRWRRPHRGRAAPFAKCSRTTSGESRASSSTRRVRILTRSPPCVPRSSATAPRQAPRRSPRA